MTGYRFVMMFDDSASPMLEAVMLQGMRSQFPLHAFETGEAPNPSLENSVIPILGVASTGDGEESWIKQLPSGLRSEIDEAFSDLLREARAAKPS